MTDVKATKVSTSATLFEQSLQYGQTNATNNGNVWGQTINAGTAGTFNQYYRYDAANRLVLATEAVAPSVMSCPSGVTWCQHYGFDGFGNIWQTENTGTITTPALKQTGSSWYDNSGAVTNRLTNTSYDAAGNQTQFPEVASPGWTVTYDSESRITEVSGTGVAGRYFYDGAGKRVKNIVSGTATAYVRDARGKLMAEYGGTSGAGSTPYYLVQDHLGSTRMITDGSGNCKARIDYLPFGGLVVSFRQACVTRPGPHSSVNHGPPKNPSTR
jgi:hypothetical protein